MLDTAHENNGGYIAKIDEEQFAWLETELKNASSDQHICVVSHIPIILISGFPPPNHFLPKGIKASLSKPLDKLELLEVIETYIQK